MAVAVARNSNSRKALAVLGVTAAMILAAAPANAAVAWSQEYAVEYGGGTNYTSAGVWADKEGRVAVTWSSIGGGHPTAWVRVYTPQTGWYAASQIVMDDSDVPVVYGAAWSPGGKLWIAFSSNSPTPSLNIILYDPAKGFSALETFGTASSMRVQTAELVSDPAGNLKVAWTTIQGRNFSVFLSTHLAGADGWDGPLEVDHVVGVVWGLDAAVLPSGEAAFIWSVNRDEMDEIWALQTTVTAPQPYAPKLVQRSGNDTLTEPHVAVSGPASVTATWTEYNQSTALSERLMASTLGSAANWSAPVEVTEAPWVEHIDIVSGPDTRPMVVWEQSMGTGAVTCFSNLDAAGNWTSPEALHEAPGASRAPSVALGPGGSVWAIWWAVDNGVGSIWARQYDGGWLPATRLSQGAFPSPETAAITVDGRGVAWAVWTDFSSPSTAWVLARAAGLPGGEEIARTTTGGSGGSPLYLLAPIVLVFAAVIVTYVVWRRSR